MGVGAGLGLGISDEFPTKKNNSAEDIIDETNGCPTGFVAEQKTPEFRFKPFAEEKNAQDYYYPISQLISFKDNVPIFSSLVFPTWLLVNLETKTYCLCCPQC
jgi:hypothetical protein